MRNWLFSFSLTFLQSHGHSRCHFLFFFFNAPYIQLRRNIKTKVSIWRRIKCFTSTLRREETSAHNRSISYGACMNYVSMAACLAFSCETFARNYIFLAAFFRLIISCTRIATFSPFISKRNYRNFVKISAKLSDKWNRRIKTNYKNEM